MWEVWYTHPVKGHTVKRSTGKRNKAEARQASIPIITNIVGKATGLTPSNANYKIGELLNAYKASKDSIADMDERALKKLSEFFAAFTPEQLATGLGSSTATGRTTRTPLQSSTNNPKSRRQLGEPPTERVPRGNPLGSAVGTLERTATVGRYYLAARRQGTEVW